MQWVMVGWSHHRTPVEIRERLAFSTEQIREVQQRLHQQFPGVETVLLSTCNRVELYCAASDASPMPQLDQLGRFLTEYHQLPYAEVESQVITLRGENSIRHLFTVASSLDSMVIGEAQILSQVKTAYEIACQGDFASTCMHQAFQHAALVAKRVASETEIHRRRVSIPSVAVSEIATEFFESFEEKRILLIGAGEMGTETLRYLVDHGANRIAVVNRSRQRAEKLADEFGAEVVNWDRMYDYLVDSDLVVSTTGASQPVITAAAFKAARAYNKSRAVLILDLAVPRDFEPQIADLSDVYLFTVDDLQAVCDKNIQARRDQWPKAQRIVEEETRKFLAEAVHRGSGATIKQLRDRVEQVKHEELQRLLGKLEARGIRDDVRREVELSFDRLVNKLLHPPLKSLRENADTTHHATLLDALRRLFQLKE
jgi:glutamyl-tRNA reductase